jgi:hypothetical protein
VSKDFNRIYRNEDLQDWSPEDKKAYIDAKLGITGGEKINDEVDDSEDFENWRHGPHYDRYVADYMASYGQLDEGQQKHIARHLPSVHKLSLLYNENVHPQLANMMYQKWVDNDYHHGYDEEHLQDHLKEANKDKMYDDDWQDMRDEAREEIENNYSVYDHIRDADIQLYEDGDVHRRLIENYNWTHDNPDFDPDEPESSENPKKINFLDDGYDIEDHPEYHDREDEAKEYLQREAMEDLPDHVWESYSESISDDVHRRFKEKWEEEANGFHNSYDNLPDHLHGHLDHINRLAENEQEAKRRKEAEAEKALGDFHDKFIPNRPKNHEYGPGQHHLEMMRDFADANNGAIDIGRMTKVYPGLKDEWKKHFGDKGKLSAQEIQSKIDAIPKTKYAISYGKWNSSQPQNSNGREQVVVRLDHTPESYAAIKGKSAQHAELFDKLQRASRMSGHPSNADTIGWTRLDLHDPENAFIDEMQTDFSKAARRQLEQAGQTEHLSTIEDIENDHKIWREAKMNFLTKLAKQNGFKKLSTHSPESKAKHTGADKVHSVYKESYKQIPRALGFRTAKREELPLSDEGRRHFISPASSYEHHEEAFHHHNNLASIYQAPSLDVGFGVPHNNPRRQQFAASHIELALKHKQKYTYLGGYKDLNNNAGILPENLPNKHIELAKESFDSGKFAAHDNDPKLDQQAQEHTGHSLDLTPSFALQKAEDWSWDFDIEDLIKIEVEEDDLFKEENKLTGVLSATADQIHGVLTETAQKHIENYTKNKDWSVPEHHWNQIMLAHNLPKEHIHKAMDLMEGKSSPYLHSLSSSDSILGMKNFDASHLDRAIQMADTSPYMKSHLVRKATQGKLNAASPEHIQKIITHSLHSNSGSYSRTLMNKNKALITPDHIDQLVEAAKKNRYLVDNLGDLSDSPHITSKHLDSLLGSDSDSIARSFAISHPKINPATLNNWIDRVEDLGRHGGKLDADFDYKLGSNPSLSEDQVKRLIKPLLNDGEGSEHKSSHHRAGTMALSHKSLGSDAIRDIISDKKNSHLGRNIIKNPNLGPEHFDTIINNHSNDSKSDLTSFMLSHPEAKEEHFDNYYSASKFHGKDVSDQFYKHAPKKYIDDLFNNKDADEDHILSALNNKHLGEEHFTKLMNHSSSNVSSFAKEKAKQEGYYEDPDKVHVAFGTTKLREARHLAASSPDKKVHKKDLEKLGLSPKDLNIHHLQDSKGYIHHDHIHDHIEKQPKLSFGYSHDTYGDDLSDYKERVEEARNDHSEAFDPEEYDVRREDYLDENKAIALHMKDFDDTVIDPDDHLDENGELDQDSYDNDIEEARRHHEMDFNLEDWQDHPDVYDEFRYERAVDEARDIHEQNFNPSNFSGINHDTEDEAYEEQMQSQLHSLEPSKVFQLNLTKDHFKQMREAGVLGTFKDMLKESHHSGHPASKGNGIGWVRYTEGDRGVHVDEIQSDFGQSFAKQAANQLKQKVQSGQMSKEEADRLQKEYETRWPEESHNKINQIIFGDRHSNEVLHEAFKQHLRDKGKEGTPIHMWDAEPKSKISGMSDNNDLPVHMRLTYKQNPKKMGYKPAKYGELDTQSNPHLHGEKTWSHVLKKARKVLNTLNKTLGKQK